MGTIHRKYYCALALLLIAWRPGSAQEESTASQSSQEPDASAQRADNPPASSLDRSLPFLSAVGTRSYVSSAIHISQGLDSDPDGVISNSSQLSSVTDVSGSVNLLRVGRASQTALDYIAGSTFYNGGNRSGNYSNQKTQLLDVEQRIFWHKTQLTFRDSLRNLRLGGFGTSPFGGASAFALRFEPSASTNPLTAAASDSLGMNRPGEPDQASLINLASVDLTRAFSRRSSAFVVGAYSFTDYLGTRNALIDDREFSVQSGYKYQLNRREEIGLVYGYTLIQLPQVGLGDIVTHSAQLLYNRQLNERMKFSLGAGPEFTSVSGDSGKSVQRVGTAVQSSILYSLEKTGIGLSYDRFVTAGSGVFAGANSNTIRLTAMRTLFRTWQTSINSGYSDVRRLASSAPNPNGTHGNSYQYIFAGVAVQRQMSQHVEVFASYQFSNQNIESLICGAPSFGCGPGVQQRHVASIGFDWRIRPVKLQ